MINDNNNQKYFLTLRIKNHDIMSLVGTILKKGESFNQVAKEERKRIIKYRRNLSLIGKFKPSDIDWGFYILENSLFKLFVSSKNFSGETIIKSEY